MACSIRVAGFLRKHRWPFAKPRADHFCSCHIFVIFAKDEITKNNFMPCFPSLKQHLTTNNFLIGTPILWPFPGAAGGEQIDWSLDKCSITYYNLWQPNSAKLGFGHFWTCDYVCVEQGRSGKELSCNLHTLWGLSHCIFCTFNHERTLSEFQDM